MRPGLDDVGMARHLEGAQRILLDPEDGHPLLMEAASSVRQ